MKLAKTRAFTNLIFTKENKVIENLRRGYFGLQVHSIKGKHTHFHSGEDTYKLIWTFSTEKVINRLLSSKYYSYCGFEWNDCLLVIYVSR